MVATPPGEPDKSAVAGSQVVDGSTVAESIDAASAGHPHARQSLFDHVEPLDADEPFGVPGPEVSRQAPLYRGFWFAIGVLLAVVVALAVREVDSVLLLVLISGFLAVGLNPIVEFQIRRGIRRGWAVLIVALSMVIIVAVIAIVVISLLNNQVSSFIDNAPHLLHKLLRHETIRHLNDRFHFITTLQNKIKDPNFGSEILQDVFSTGLGALQDAASTGIVIILSLYFLGALPEIKRALYSMAPESRRVRVGQLGDEILRRTGRFVIGSFLVALLAGTVTLIFLLCVGLGRYAVPLALLVALLDLVPLVGSITGAAIVTVIGLATSLPIGIAAAIFYLIYEPIEGYVIYPRVMRSSVDVPEYVTIMAVLLGGSLGGVVGALVALPMAAGALLLAREVWVRRQDTR